MKLKFLLYLLLSLSLFIGCDEDDEPEPKPHRQYAASIDMTLGTDTLWFTPGDSASTTVSIIVSDFDGNPFEGSKVNLSLSNPQLGFIEFLDTELRDTTNALGQVNLLYTAIGYAGDCVISAATAGGGIGYVCLGSDRHSELSFESRGESHLDNLTVTKTLTIREAEPQIGVISLTASPSEITAMLGDSVGIELCVTIADLEGFAIAGISLPMHTTEGRLTPLPATNYEGRACTDWILSASQGDHCVYINMGQRIDSACIHIDIVDSLAISEGGFARCE